MKEKKEYLTHPGRNLQDVMKDVFAQHLEESFYFLNKGRLKGTAEVFQKHFLLEDFRRRIAYALKANPHSEVLRILTEAGIDSFDCASIGEIKQVRSISSELEIFFNNLNEKRTEIEQALVKNVCHFTVDLSTEVGKIVLIRSEETDEIEGMTFGYYDSFGTKFFTVSSSNRYSGCSTSVIWINNKYFVEAKGV